MSLNQSYKKAGFFGQTSILLKKNFKVTLGKWNFCTGHIVTLVLVCLIILFINYLTKYSYDNEPARIYPVEQVSNLEKCNFDPSCKSLGYVQIGPDKPWIEFVLNDIAEKSKLSVNDDFKLLYKGDNVTEALSDIKKKNSNSFSTIVVLCTSSFTFGNLSIPCTAFGAYTYWLLYNQSLVKQNFLDNMNAPLKLSMDAIRTARMVENALSTHKILVLTTFYAQEIGAEWPNNLISNVTVTTPFSNNTLWRLLVLYNGECQLLREVSRRDVISDPQDFRQIRFPNNLRLQESKYPDWGTDFSEETDSSRTASLEKKWEGVDQLPFRLSYFLDDSYSAKDIRININNTGGEAIIDTVLTDIKLHRFGVYTLVYTKDLPKDSLSLVADFVPSSPYPALAFSWLYILLWVVLRRLRQLTHCH